MGTVRTNRCHALFDENTFAASELKLWFYYPLLRHWCYRWGWDSRRFAAENSYCHHWPIKMVEIPPLFLLVLRSPLISHPFTLFQSSNHMSPDFQVERFVSKLLGASVIFFSKHQKLAHAWSLQNSGSKLGNRWK